MTTSIIQAMATGLPAITTNHSAFPDQIKEGRNGFLVSEGDFEALAEKILYMMDHPELWPEFGRFGREHVQKNYDSKALIEKQINFYKQVINENK
jgi:colanic acid/amylovoran biosynthesis glycosyltransferase